MSRPPNNIAFFTKDKIAALQPLRDAALQNELKDPQCKGVSPAKLKSEFLKQAEYLVGFSSASNKMLCDEGHSLADSVNKDGEWNPRPTFNDEYYDHYREKPIAVLQNMYNTAIFPKVDTDLKKLKKDELFNKLRNLVGLQQSQKQLDKIETSADRDDDVPSKPVADLPVIVAAADAAAAAIPSLDEPNLTVKKKDKKKEKKDDVPAAVAQAAVAQAAAVVPAEVVPAAVAPAAVAAVENAGFYSITLRNKTTEKKILYNNVLQGDEKGNTIPPNLGDIIYSKQTAVKLATDIIKCRPDYLFLVDANTEIKNQKDVYDVLLQLTNDITQKAVAAQAAGTQVSDSNACAAIPVTLNVEPVAPSTITIPKIVIPADDGKEDQYPTTITSAPSTPTSAPSTPTTAPSTPTAAATVATAAASDRPVATAAASGRPPVPEQLEQKDQIAQIAQAPPPSIPVVENRLDSFDDYYTVAPVGLQDFHALLYKPSDIRRQNKVQLEQTILKCLAF